MLSRILLILTLALALGPRPSFANQKVLRVALMIGHNSGGPRLGKLTYAQKDVTRVAKVLRELGGYLPRNIHILRGPTVRQVRQKLRQIRAMFKNRKQGVFLFYYSGHSNYNAFLLNREQLDHQEILRFARKLPVSLRLLIIDSCYSGGLVAGKGISRRRSKKVWIPRHLKQINHRGEAILSSSGQLKKSYEVRELKSSLFTASLLSGLRGSADANNDEVVTLGEIKEYVYRRTIDYSDKYKLSRQRPHYKINIRGRGPLKLTYLRRADSHIILDGNIRGDVILRRGNALIEYKKIKGKPLRVGLRAGKYELEVQDKGWFARQEIQLKSSAVKRISQVRWQQLSVRRQLNKGYYTHTTRLVLQGHYTPVAQQFVHGAGLSLGLDLYRWFRPGIRYQFAPMNLNNFPYQAHELGFPVAFGYGFGFSIFAAWFGVYVEPRLSIRASTQSPDTLLNLGAIVGATSSFDIHFNRNVVFRISISGGLQTIFFDSTPKLAPLLDVGLGVAWRPN